MIDHDEVDDREDRDDEQPQIVALKDGDLTAEQVKAEKDNNSIGTKIITHFVSRLAATQQNFSMV